MSRDTGSRTAVWGAWPVSVATAIPLGHAAFLPGRGGRGLLTGLLAQCYLLARGNGLAGWDFVTKWREFKMQGAMQRLNRKSRKPARIGVIKRRGVPRRVAGYQRETDANIGRIISTAGLILKAHEFDDTTEGAMMRLTADRTIELWTMLPR